THGYAAAAVTGKPLDRSGSPGREQAPGRGLAIMLREAARTAQLEPEGLRVAIQGYGAAIPQMASEIEALGCKLVAITDSQSGIFSHRGIRASDIKRHFAKGSPVGKFRAIKAIADSEILECDCDVLVLGGLDTALTASNAARVRAQLVMEAADLAITSDADRLLGDARITEIPYLLTHP